MRKGTGTFVDPQTEELATVEMAIMHTRDCIMHRFDCDKNSPTNSVQYRWAF